MTNDKTEDKSTLDHPTSPASPQIDETPQSPASAEDPNPSLSIENPLLIKRMQKNSLGGLDYTFSLTAQQTYVLLNFAIMFLVTQGLAVFVQTQEEEASPGEVIVLGDQLH